MSTVDITVTLAGSKQYFLLAAGGVDVSVLKALGASKGVSKSDGGQMRFPLRYADLQRLSDNGLSVEYVGEAEHVVNELMQRDRTHVYLQSATEIVREAKHCSWHKLLPHQRVGVAYLTVTPRALLTFTPRLGKTPTSVIAAEVLNLRTILVVTPKTVIGTFVRGIRRWAQDSNNITVAHGAPPANLDTDNGRQWVVTNPESIALRKTEWVRWCAHNKVDVLILDESLLYKNHRSKRQKVMVELGRVIERIWELTGNPTGKYADQLFGQLQILRPDVFSSYWAFAADWCILTKTPWATEVSGNRKSKELREYLRDIMISRTPNEVPVLPELQFDIVEVALSKEQERIIDYMSTYMALPDQKDADGNDIVFTNVLQLATRMAQVVSNPHGIGYAVPSAKTAAAFELLETAETPAIVWFNFVDSLTEFAAAASSKKYRVGMIHGGVNDKKRQEAIDAFQRGDLDILCVQLLTGKYGLDFTSGKTVIYYDRAMDIDSWVQSTHRTRHIENRVTAAGYVLHGGFSDFVIDRILDKKITSLSQMSLTDLLEITKKVTSRTKTRRVAQAGPR